MYFTVIASLNNIIQMWQIRYLRDRYFIILNTIRNGNIIKPVVLEM